VSKYHSNLKAEVRKHWRMRAREEMEKRGQPLPPDLQESQPGDGDLFPPEPQIVAQRACCLAAVGLRGLATSWSVQDQTEFLPRLKNWVDQVGLSNWCEKSEREALDAPAGGLEQRSAINSCWKWEGAAVLLASLGKVKLPPHDEVVDTQVCGRAAMLFDPPEQVLAAIASVTFDSQFDRFGFADRILAIHWRLRQFKQIGPKPIDFATYAKGVKWATFNLEGVALVEGDLSIGGMPISKATQESLSRAMSIAMERHQAANWLTGWATEYHKVECPT
jgi:hypothetical protein